MSTKRPHSAISATPAPEDEPVDPSDELTFVALGGGNEVGRSCHIVQYKGKTIMLDAGAHPAYEGHAALPYYDEFDLSSVDALLITHCHMDHAASLPYVLAKTNFSGKVYMTHATKAIYKHFMQDSVRVQNTYTTGAGGNDSQVFQLFNEQDILGTLPLIQTISFNTTHTHNGIRITPYPAGHILGACMYLIEIAGLNILFTGDYSREDDRHLIPASVPRNVRIDCLITESTFGISSHIPRQQREASLMKSITSILNRGGRALLPVFAMGRAQELLLILEEYWTRHEQYQHVPIYYASSLARKCMVVYQTYVDSMNENIRNKLNQAASAANGTSGGPWDFEYIRSLKDLSRFDDMGPCVMLASPGMLQNGVSRSLLERWAPDAKNGVVITGYSVEGTMAKQIMQNPDSIPAVMTNRQPAGGVMGPKRPGLDDKTMVPRRCSVEEISFAAHVDGQENREFIEEVNAPVVILVHGEKHNMARLKSRLISLNKKWKVYNPVNCEFVRIPFRQDKIARVVGRLASEISPPELLPSPPASPDDGEDDDDGKESKKSKVDGGQVLSGVLVQNDFKLSLMAPEDLKEYAGLMTTTILCRQRLTLASASTELIYWALEGTFGSIDITKPRSKQRNGEVPKSEDVEEVPRAQDTIMEVMGGAVRIICHRDGELELEWEGNSMNDSIADAVMAVLLTVESSPAAIRQSSKMHAHTHENGHSNGNGKQTDGPLRENNPLASINAQDRLDRLFMFLETNFGEEAITPIEQPKLVDTEDQDDTVTLEKRQKAELQRLHNAGLPVPGLQIRVDKNVAKVWLETLEVECANKSLADRVKALVERGIGTAAPIWA